MHHRVINQLLKNHNDWYVRGDSMDYRLKMADANDDDVVVVVIRDWYRMNDVQ